MRNIADRPEFDQKAHQKFSLQPLMHLTSQNIPARWWFLRDYYFKHYWSSVKSGKSPSLDETMNDVFVVYSMLESFKYRNKFYSNSQRIHFLLVGQHANEEVNILSQSQDKVRGRSNTYLLEDTKKQTTILYIEDVLRLIRWWRYQLQMITY